MPHRPVSSVAGFCAPLETWELQRPALLEAGYRFVAVDRRSHGGSDSPPYGQRMARHGKDLWDVLTGLDLDDAVLIGGSMGGSTIWAYCDLFGTERLDHELSNCALQAESLLQSVLRAVEAFADGRAADDDRTLIVARVV